MRGQGQGGRARTNNRWMVCVTSEGTMFMCAI